MITIEYTWNSLIILSKPYSSKETLFLVFFKEKLIAVKISSTGETEFKTETLFVTNQISDKKTVNAIHKTVRFFGLKSENVVFINQPALNSWNRG